MRRLTRALTVIVGVSLTATVALVALVQGLEQASWLAGVGSLLLALGTIGTLHAGGAGRIPRPVPSLSLPRRGQIDSASGSLMDDVLLRLWRDHNWMVDRHAEVGIRVVFWPVHLRPPTVIHAVQASVAAAMSARGAEVIVCIEDLHEEAPQSLTNDLMKAIDVWFAQVPGATNIVRYESVRRHLESTRIGEADADPWRLAEAYYRRTTVLDVLAESKIMKRTAGGRLASKLDGANAYRLLTAPAIWSLMHHLMREIDLGEVITLGGMDERGMWQRWHGIRHGRLNHLYNPMLVGLEHGNPMLRWSTLAEFRRSLAESQVASTDDSGLLHWVATNALLLPASIHRRNPIKLAGRDCSTWAEIQELLHLEKNQVIADIAQQVSEFYLAARR